jgi:hypothetical protein
VTSSQYRAKDYRDRAAEIRVVATRMSADETRKVMFGIADSYERMASQLEGPKSASRAGSRNDANG